MHNINKRQNKYHCSFTQNNFESTVRYIQSCWERDRTPKSTSDWTGYAAAGELGVFKKQFSPTGTWPILPVSQG